MIKLGSKDRRKEENEIWESRKKGRKMKMEQQDWAHREIKVDVLVYDDGLFQQLLWNCNKAREFMV